jgi:putative ABC transport system permease protein
MRNLIDKKMNLLLTLSWRNLWRNRKRTLITMSSVMFAVLLAIIFTSMEQGSYERMIDSMVKYSTGYIQIQDVMYNEEPSIDHTLLYNEEVQDILDKHAEEISFYVPRLQNFALVAGENTTRGTMVMGIDPELEIKLNDLSDDIVEGSFLSQDDEGILVAEGLADILGVKIGDTLVLLGQGFQGMTASGKYAVQGIADLKIPELNNNIIYMSLATAQWFYGAEDRLTALIVMPENPKRTNQLAQNLLEDLDKEWYKVITWEELLKDLLTLMKFDVAGTQVMMMILYIVIAFGLFGTIVMMMLERQREFGLLFSLGMKRRLLASVCFMESLFIAIGGTLAGIVASIPVVAYFYHRPIRLTGEMAEAIAEYGFEPILPFSTEPSIFFTQAILVLILSILIGLYPVYKVFRLKIMDVKQ